MKKNSIILYTKSSNGNVLSKEQEQQVQTIYKRDPYLNKVLPFILNQGYIPFFELQNSSNKNETKLFLVQLKSKDNDAFLSNKKIKQLTNNLGINLSKNILN